MKIDDLVFSNMMIFQFVKSNTSLPGRLPRDAPDLELEKAWWMGSSTSLGAWNGDLRELKYNKSPT